MEASFCAYYNFAQEMRETVRSLYSYHYFSVQLKQKAVQCPLSKRRPQWFTIPQSSYICPFPIIYSKDKRKGIFTSMFIFLLFEVNRFRQSISTLLVLNISMCFVCSQSQPHERQSQLSNLSGLLNSLMHPLSVKSFLSMGRQIILNFSKSRIYLPHLLQRQMVLNLPVIVLSTIELLRERSLAIYFQQRSSSGYWQQVSISAHFWGGEAVLDYQAMRFRTVEISSLASFWQFPKNCGLYVSMKCFSLKGGWEEVLSFSQTSLYSCMNYFSCLRVDISLLRIAVWNRHQRPLFMQQVLPMLGSPFSTGIF